MAGAPTLGLFGRSTPAGAVVLVAQAAYHLDDYVPTMARLAARSIPSVLACVVPPPSVLRRWRSSWWRHTELMHRGAELGIGPVGARTIDDVLASAGAFVVRNDWGPSRTMVEAAGARGVPTIGWVEGVQDFADADTGRARHPYRTVDHVLCLGADDRDQLAGLDTTIVGSQRLWARYHGEPTTADGPAVANVNFTYGVLEEARSPWVADVLGAAASTGTPLVLSRHPADRGRRGRRAESSQPVSELLQDAPRLVSRFSTLCYEALAVGVELVYHNPHGETVPTFSEPDGAFSITVDRSELIAALSAPPRSPVDVRAAARTFLARHLALDVEPARRAAERIALLVR